jgi:hypothetical protein
MQTIVSLIVELAFVAIVVSAIQLLVLIFRNPHRPQWLRYGGTEAVAVLLIVAGVTLSIATLITGLVGAIGNVFASLIIAAIIPIAVAMVNQRIFRIGERLRRSDAGVSPFGPLADGHVHPDPASPASA